MFFKGAQVLRADDCLDLGTLRCGQVEHIAGILIVQGGDHPPRSSPGSRAQQLNVVREGRYQQAVVFHLAVEVCSEVQVLGSVLR